MPLSAAKVKELCSDEDITARELYAGLEVFTPQHTLWLATNHRPTVPADDQAVWNRLRLIPFEAVVSEAEKDLSLDEKLAEEAQGFLAMLVREAVEWQRSGLLDSTATEDSTAEWREQVRSTAGVGGVAGRVPGHGTAGSSATDADGRKGAP